MSDIKFRVWIKKEKKMKDVVAIDWLNEIVALYINFGITNFKFDEVELMQWTGLKGAHEEYIFEGDIVLDLDFFEIGVVKKDHYQFYVEGTEDLDFCDAADSNTGIAQIEVLGNIYENSIDKFINEDIKGV